MTRVICHNHVERGLDVTVTISSCEVSCLTNDTENMPCVICHNHVERGLDVTVTVNSCEVSCLTNDTENMPASRLYRNDAW